MKDEKWRVKVAAQARKVDAEGRSTVLEEEMQNRRTNRVLWCSWTRAQWMPRRGNIWNSLTIIFFFPNRRSTVVVMAVPIMIVSM